MPDKRKRGRKDQKPKKLLGRLLHMEDGTVWRWLAQGGGLTLWDPDGRKILLDWGILTGWTPDQQERAAWKGYWPALRPGELKKWILEHDMTTPCKGSHITVKPTPTEHEDGRISFKFSPEQEYCPVCGELIPIIGWAVPRHYPLRNNPRAKVPA